ncbi:MAG: alpha-mannosidase [Clostridia bacterium]|nr:alpha-mannosidase [Clostridia bacterium]
MFNEKYVFENLRNCVQRVKNRVYTKVSDLDIEIYKSKEPIPFAQRTTGEYRKVQVGESWGELFDCAWFHFTGRVPEEAKGKKIVYVIDINGEGLIYDDSGCPLRGVTNVNSTFDRAMGNPGKRIIQFKEAAQGGDPVDFWMDAGCNDLTGNLKENGRIKEAFLASCNDIARTLFYDMIVLLVQAENTPNEDPIKYEILNVLSQCRKELIHFDESEMKKCLEITGKRLAMQGGENPAVSLTAFGHAHIDLAWLWPLRETRRKGARTFATALELMNRYPDYLFGASQPQLYDWVKEDHPDLYAKVKKTIADGRWELLGGVWVEPDLNLISGESVVRQILYGNAFWQKEFGQRTNYVWTPDTFGYSAALPQIFRKAGIEYFATIKMSWNLINDFPYTNFRWKGIDGSEVLVHMPPEGSYVSEGTARSVRRATRRLAQNGQFGEALLPFGIGDGGGGPSPSHLEYLKRERNLPGLCPITPGKMADFFERLKERADELPVWADEMYLERHLGVYTSAARNKYYNRLMEKTLRDAEFFAAIAHREAGFAYPAEDFERIWKEVLLYQFHDILPGSSIQRVYNECLERYQALYEETKALRDEAVSVLAKQISVPAQKRPAAIFNTLSFAREYTVESDEGMMTVTLPPMGYAVVDLAGETVRSDMTALENAYVKVTLAEDGSIQSIYNKEIGRELLNGPSNILYIYDDMENAWNLQYDYRNQTPDRVPLVESRTEVGPCGVTVIQKYHYGTSDMVLSLSLGPNDRVLEVKADVDWHEMHKMLRIAFHTVIDSDDVRCETQFGTVKRSTRNNTTEQQAQIEMAAHRWIALSETGLNFALLNDCKYGYGVEDNVIELNALRGTNYPATDLDFGKQTFRYGIYSDAEASLLQTVRAAACFNTEPQMCEVAVGDGETAHSYLSISADNVIIDGVKKAENSDGLVVRTYEATGRRTKAKLNGLDGETVYRCNLCEEKEERVTDETDYRPFEIHSFQIESNK